MGCNRLNRSKKGYLYLLRVFLYLHKIVKSGNGSFTASIGGPCCQFQWLNLIYQENRK